MKCVRKVLKDERDMDNLSAKYPFIAAIIIMALCIAGMRFANRATRKKKDKRKMYLTAISGFFAFVVLIFMLAVLMLDAI